MTSQDLTSKDMDTLYLLSLPLIAGVLMIIKDDMSAPDFCILRQFNPYVK